MYALAAFGGGVVFTYALVPLLIPLLQRFGIQDAAIASKVHTHTTPRGAGVVMCGAWLVCNVVLLGTARLSVVYMWTLVLPPLGMCILGLVDDVRHLSPRLRLVVEILLGSFVAAQGYCRAGHHSWVLFLAALFWFVGITNAMNLVDGLNGLAGGLAMLGSLAMGVLASLSGLSWIALPSFVLCGASTGFLPFNFPRARTFMGDAGSLFLGSAFACLGLQWAISAPADMTLLPGLIIGVPVLDTLATILRRLVYGRPIFEGDLEHVYNLLSDALGSPVRAVLVMWLLGALSGAGAIVWLVLPPMRYIVLTLGFFVAIVTVLKAWRTRSFGMS